MSTIYTIDKTYHSADNCYPPKAGHTNIQTYLQKQTSYFDSTSTDLHQTLPADRGSEAISCIPNLFWPDP